MGKTLSPLSIPKVSRCWDMGRETHRKRDENVDKWSERVILSKDIKSHGDSIVSTLTAMNFKTTQLQATLPAF